VSALAAAGGRTGWRIPFFLLAGGSLAGAGWAGLSRLGLAPAIAGAPAAMHGPVMVMGFLGSLIGLERAVAYGRRWAFAAPGLTGLGAVALLAGLPTTLAQVALVLGSAALALISLALLRLQPSSQGAVLVVAALVGVTGNVAWGLGLPVHQVVPWWTVFLVLVIAAERLELSRLGWVSPASRVAFAGSLVLLVAGLVVALVWGSGGQRLAGLGLLALGLWLLRHDIARRTVRSAGIPRFMAIAALAGYGWLLLAGLLWVALGSSTGGGAYDAEVHATLVGFVISMVFAHAPVIAAAVLRLPLVFSRAFYAHLGLLHLALAMRIGSDVSGQPDLARLGALGGGIALLIFPLNTALAVVRSRTAAHRLL